MASDSTGKASVHPRDGHPRDGHPRDGQPKALLRLVKIMGVLLVLLFVGLIGGIIWKAMHRQTAMVAPQVPLKLNFSGAEVLHMALDGNHLAITAAHDIIVIDIRTGQTLINLPLK